RTPDHKIPPPCPGDCNSHQIPPEATALYPIHASVLPHDAVQVLECHNGCGEEEFSADNGEKSGDYHVQLADNNFCRAAAIGVTGEARSFPHLKASKMQCDGRRETGGFAIRANKPAERPFGDKRLVNHGGIAEGDGAEMVWRKETLIRR